MALPNLVHPINVKIQTHDFSEQSMLNKEPRHGVRSSTEYTIEAQIKWIDKDLETAQSAGVNELADGYILVREKDMIDLSVTFKNGDKIIELGHQTGLELFIVRNQPMASYPDQNGTSLVRYYFMDRKPVSGAAELE